MYIEREINSHFKKVNNIYSAIALVGPRQAGKTTFLKEHIKHQHSSYVLFDDPDARALFEEDIKKFEKQYMKGYDLTVLDEVQYCKDAGTKLKYLIDSGRKIWITSSSETILGKDVLSYLVGRVSVIRLFQFSLREFLAAKNQKETTQKILERSIWEHITYGGYPKAVITEDFEMKKQILKDLHETILLKDVAKTFSIEDTNTLEELVKYLSLNIGNMMSYNNITRDLKISFQTLKKYLDALEKSYVIVRTKPYYTNKIKEITKQPKIHFVDTGLRNHAAKAFAIEPDGMLFENYVLNELIKLGFSPKYWRSKSNAEVDFIVEKDNEIVPIEVKLNIGTEKIERSLRTFIETYKPKKALVVSYRGPKSRININGCTITFTDAFNMKDALLSCDS